MNIVLRVVLTLFLAFCLIGFGMCGLLGFAASAGDAEPGIMILALIGLAIAGACGYAIYKIWAKKQLDESAGPDA
ncbi:hypothetical protein [Pseudoduganella sp. RAF53_2]|jgi:hypothetical protein|uniref:hypothetical protein n=1 Tax=unclassified Pseudoduganella TaxID=2637179 RepID=UPI003F965DB3